MRYLFAFIICCFSFSAGAVGLKYELDEARKNYTAAAQRAMEEYERASEVPGNDLQFIRRIYFNSEMRARAKFYNDSDIACLRYTGNKCRWD